MMTISMTSKTIRITITMHSNRIEPWLRKRARRKKNSNSLLDTQMDLRMDYTIEI